MSSDKQNSWPPKKSWLSKFKNAARGIGIGIKGQNSFLVHLPVAVLVVTAAWWLSLELVEFMVLLLCIAMVLTAELVNSSIEHIAKAITEEFDDQVRRSLDIASGAVLMATLFAVIVGLVVLGQGVLKLF